MIEYGPFRGLYSRDDKELVPNKYLSEARNIDFKGKMLIRRPRFRVMSGTANRKYKKLFNFSRTNVRGDVNTSNLIALGDAADTVYSKVLRDLTTGANILTQVDDFHAVNYLHRAFIATRSGNSYRSLSYYNGLTLKTAGLSSTLAEIPLTITSNNSGNIGVGHYHIGYVLETDSGYFSTPRRITDYLSDSSVGSLIEVTGRSKSLTIAADFNSIRAGIKRVHYISTSLIPESAIEYPADSFAYYFIPDAILEKDEQGMFPTTLEVNYFPPSLFSSVDHLFKQHSTIAGGYGLATYANRLCIWGGKDLTDQSILRISRVNEPESFSRTDGFLVIAPEINSPITNVFEFRGDLYITKRNSTYLTRDNGGEPATWPVVTVDKGIGSEVTSTVRDSQGTNLDFVTVGTNYSLFMFDGVYRRPELSYNIEDLYSNPKAIVRDPNTKKIYVIANHCIYACDYTEGINRDGLRWAEWYFGIIEIYDMLIDSLGTIIISTGLGVLEQQSLTDGNVSITTGSLGGGAGGAKHFGEVLVNKSDGGMRIQLIGRRSGRQGTRDIADGDGVFRSIYAFTDDSAQVNLTASEAFELETISLDIQRLWEVPARD